MRRVYRGGVEVQNQIKRVLSEQNSIESIGRLLRENVYAYRSTFADAVCQQFGFYDARGRVQRSGCIKALRELERLGHFALPPASAMGAKGAKRPRRLGAPVEDPHDVPEQAGDVRELCLTKVDTLALMRIWNEMMLCEHPQGAGPLVGAQMRYEEFGGAKLGDRRLSERLVQSARTLATMPGQAFSGVARGDWAAVKGYYRLIDQPDDSQVTVEAILAPHRARTVQRMKAHPTVLCIQDGSDLNYSGLARCEGLGVMGANQTGARGSGLHLHSTLVVSTEGLPIGVLKAQFTAPAAKSAEDARYASVQPIEQKKTFAWIAGASV